MKLCIMQPYFFPYIGYFQLIAAVDQFVIHDDVQWIKGGWINRNRILVQGQPHYITLPLQKQSSLLNINERKLSLDIDLQGKKIIRQIEGAYKKAPYIDTVLALLNRCFDSPKRDASVFIVNALRECCDYLQVNTPFIMSSDLDKRNELRAEERVLNINMVMGANHYINPVGGAELYDRMRFSENGLKLSFIKARDISYQQFQNHEFVPFLSIIDVMMFNSQHEITDLLHEYDLQ